MNASVRDLKSRLSRYLQQVQRGETVVVTSRGKPIARLVPLPSLPLEERLATLPGINAGTGESREVRRAPCASNPERKALRTSWWKSDGDPLSRHIGSRQAVRRGGRLRYGAWLGGCGRGNRLPMARIRGGAIRFGCQTAFGRPVRCRVGGMQEGAGGGLGAISPCRGHPDPAATSRCSERATRRTRL